MKLDPNRLAIAFGGTTAILWIACSAFFGMMPGQMMMMTGHMLHADPTGFGWTLTVGGFLYGLIAWIVVAMLAGWLVGWIYNWLGRPGAS